MFLRQYCYRCADIRQWWPVRAQDRLGGQRSGTVQVSARPVRRPGGFINRRRSQQRPRVAADSRRTLRASSADQGRRSSSALRRRHYHRRTAGRHRERKQPSRYQTIPDLTYQTAAYTLADVDAALQLRIAGKEISGEKSKHANRCQWKMQELNVCNSDIFHTQ